MKLLLSLIIGAISLLATPHSIQVYTTKDPSNKVTPKTIEAAFNSVGLDILANNDMNKPFQARFKHTHYPVYNLAIFLNNDLSIALLKKYPQFGVLTPMTMSIWRENDHVYISTLSLYGISRATHIPLKEKLLRDYTALIHKALKKALPHGSFKKLPYTPQDQGKDFLVDFSTKVTLEDDQEMGEYEENFEDEFTGELEPLGFLFPNYLNIKEDLFEEEEGAYDFYNTLSICKFDVIFPVSKLHPEVGAYAPCTFFIYKKKDETTMHMGFLGVENWIETANIEDSASIKPLQEAQKMITDVIKNIIE